MTFRVTTQTGPITVPVELRALRDARLFFTAQDAQIGGLGAVDGFVNVLLFSIRGRQCAHVALEAYKTAFDHGQAKFYIHAWGADGIYGDRATVLPVQPFGDITQQLRAAQELEDIAEEDIEFVDNLGTGQVLNPTGGRIDITRITISHEEEVPVLYTLTTLNEGTGSQVEGLFLVHPDTNYVEEFTYPLRGRPSARWRIMPDVFSGGGVRHVVNTIGILE